ncbi:MAG: hypothetical protein AAF078_14500, partial [Planctomycetota bacterium]
ELVPVLLTELDEESFERCDAAKASGIGGAVAVPVFDESRLTSVALLMLRASGMTGAIELWAGRRGRFELGLAETFAPGLERFAKLSRYVGFPKGSGLPGLVWETSRPRLLRGIGTSNQFLRSSGAETSGLTTGFGYPVRRGNELLAVVLWLSSSVSPLARRHELWETPDGSSAGLKLTDVADANADEHRHGALEPFVREAGETRRPVVFDAAGLSVADGDNAVSAGIALPVLVHDRLGAVGVLAW